MENLSAPDIHDDGYNATTAISEATIPSIDMDVTEIDHIEEASLRKDLVDFGFQKASDLYHLTNHRPQIDQLGISLNYSKIYPNTYNLYIYS